MGRNNDAAKLERPTFMTSPALDAQVYTALTGLTPGAFEQFVCDAITEIVGTRVRRAKSGSQFGGDGGADGSSGLVVECKRYVSSTLSDSELVGKLHDAHARGCDLWVLAATCEVPEQTAKRLTAAAADLGLVTFSIDWPKGQSKPLLALAAGAVRASAHHLGEGLLTPALLAQDPDLKAAIDRLVLLLDTPLLSLEMLGLRLGERLDASLEDPSALASDFGARPPAAPKAGGVWGGFVERQAATQQLDAWWNGPASRGGGPAVLLGDEGVGKSLTALRWLSARAAEGALIIPVNSTIATMSDDPFDLITAVARRFFGDSADRWRKRLIAFLSHAHSRKLRIVLYLDGINERPDAPWLGLLRALQAQPFAGQVSVLISCRPWPYAHRFMGFTALEQPPVEVPVGLFDDHELDQVLALHHRRASEFPVEMRPLLARPRLLAMALRLEDQLRAAGEYTPTRLFWADWRDRLRFGRRIISEPEYRAALVHLAGILDRRQRESWPLADQADLRAAIDKAQTGALSPGRYDQTYSDIVDGGLARLDDDLKLRLDPTFAAMALGLELRFLLVQQSRQADQGHFSLKDEAQRILEPWGGADFGAAVARFAAWACWESTSTPLAVRSAVLALWLSEQNAAEGQIADAAALVRRDAAPAFAAADDLWATAPEGNGARMLQRAFADALSPTHKAGADRATMIDRARTWAGAIGLDRFVNTMTTRPPSAQRAEGLEQLRRTSGVEIELDRPFELLGEVLRVSEFRHGDRDAAATLGLDALSAGGSSDLDPIVRAAAIAGVIDTGDLALTCIRALRRLEAPEEPMRRRLHALRDDWRTQGSPYAVEAADQLAFILDLPHETDENPHPLTALFWPGAGSAFWDRIRSFRHDHVDDHLLREALLEPDAPLTDEILAAAEQHERGNVSFGVVRQAARARALAASRSQTSQRPVTDAPSREVGPSGPTALDPAGLLAKLDTALFDTDAPAGQGALEALFNDAANLAGLDRLRLLATTGRKISDGKTVAFARDEGALSGRWLASRLREDSAPLGQLIDKLLGPRADVFDGHHEARPGLLFGLTQAALLLALPQAPRLWAALSSNWQDYLLLPDQRHWYFDLPFEAESSPEVDLLRERALAAADRESRLLDICLSIRRWGRQAWLDAQIEADATSDTGWRVARAFVLDGMMGRDPSARRARDPLMAPTWLEAANLVGFRYARRAARMAFWLAIAGGDPTSEQVRLAAAVLEQDADRRLFGMLAPPIAEPDHPLHTVLSSLEGRDVHSPAGGFMHDFLGIPPHPWLGPPGLPASPYK